VTSRADRERHVAQMLASSRLEGIEPDETDQLLLQGYVKGTVSLEDLLTHARQFATAAAYDEWLRAHVQTAIDGPRTSISHDQVMAEMRALIKRKRQ